MSLAESNNNNTKDVQQEDGWVLRLDRQAVDHAAFDSWYPLFSRTKGDKTSKQHTIRSVILPMSDEFLAYLQQDGVIMPNVPEGVDLAVADPRYVVAAPEDTYDAFGDVDWEQDESEDELDEAEAPCFKDLEATLQETLDELKGEAFVKLRWTSPQDAHWVCGGLRCSTPGHVYLLLKSSDFIQHDLEHVYDNCWDTTNPNVTSTEEKAESEDDSPSLASTKQNPCLVMRRWSHLNRAMEFRCFIYNNQLLAITQRYPQDYHAYLQPGQPMHETVVSSIMSFFDEAEVPDRYPHPHFVMDVYVDREERVWVLDFGPLPTFIPEVEVSESTTDYHRLMQCSQQLVSVPPHELLSWAELRRLISLAENDKETDPDPEFYVVKSRQAAESTRDVKRSHCVPIELVTGELTPEIFKQAQEQLDAMNNPKSEATP